MFAVSSRLAIVALVTALGCGRIGFDVSGEHRDAAPSMDAPGPLMDGAVGLDRMAGLDGRATDAIGDDGATIDSSALDAPLADAPATDSPLPPADGGSECGEGLSCIEPDICETADSCCICVSSPGLPCWRCATPTANPVGCPPAPPVVTTACTTNLLQCAYCTPGDMPYFTYCRTSSWARLDPIGCTL